MLGLATAGVVVLTALVALVTLWTARPAAFGMLLLAGAAIGAAVLLVPVIFPLVNAL